MRTTSCLRWTIVIAGTILASTPVGAQPISAPRSPTFSPYLNLLRNGGSPALNYYGLVRPEQTLRQAVQGAQSTLTSNQRTLNDLVTGELAPTGVQTQFFNHRSYFFNQGIGTTFGTGATPLGTGNRSQQPVPSAQGARGFGGAGMGAIPRR